jgi:hypothetical protein
MSLRNLVSASMLLTLVAGCGALLPPGDREANKITEQYKENAFTKCGDDYVSYEGWVNGATNRLTAYRGLSVTYAEFTVSDADRLNGVEWKGRISVQCSAHRNLTNQGWTQWSGGCVNGAWPLPDGHYMDVPINIMKYKGRWFRETLRGNVPIEEYSIKRAACGD